MIHNVLAVKDTATQVFFPPFTVRHVNQGLRDFKDQINAADSKLGQHAADFELWHLSDYNDDTGQFYELTGGSVRVARAQDLKDAPRDVPIDATWAANNLRKQA